MSSHPYYPRDLKLPHYVPNERSSQELHTVFSILILIIITSTWFVTGLSAQKFSLLRRSVLCWFVFSACMQGMMDGYLALYHDSLAGHKTLLGEVWKEYAKSDSRYMSSDTFAVCLGTTAAVIFAPLGLLTFVAFMKGSTYRYGLQLMVSLCHLYGVVLYYFTAYQEGFRYSPTDDLFFFYSNVIGLKAPWFFVPILLIVDSMRHISACQAVSDRHVDESNRKKKKS